MKVDFIKPVGLWDSTKIGFSQVVRVSNAGTIIWLAGQGPHDMSGNRAEDFEGQARSVFQNLKLGLEAAGATFNDVVKMNVFMKDIDKNQDIFRKVRAEFINTQSPPASTMVETTGLAQKGMLVEVEVVAVLP
ncbi:MAG: RidA family protein [Syntrophales bacterium LBB04]|nr:RidA family protein [Syntrophales bacterium LBB04]